MSIHICTECRMEKVHKARGLCNTCYARRSRHGTLPSSMMKRPTSPERFWGTVDTSAGIEGCWPWLGSVSPTGYGRTSGGLVRRKGAISAHIAAWTLTHGPPPKGLHLDHLCHTKASDCRLGDECPHRRCCNPRHLEPVTPSENARRARRDERPVSLVKAPKKQKRAPRTHCSEGHALTQSNVTHRWNQGGVICRQCRNAYMRAWNRKQKMG